MGLNNAYHDIDNACLRNSRGRPPMPRRRRWPFSPPLTAIRAMCLPQVSLLLHQRRLYLRQLKHQCQRQHCCWFTDSFSCGYIITATSAGGSCVTASSDQTISANISSGRSSCATSAGGIAQSSQRQPPERHDNG